jgi:hypothetical protein
MTEPSTAIIIRKKQDLLGIIGSMRDVKLKESNKEISKTLIIRNGLKALEIIKSIRTVKDLKESNKEILFHINNKVQEIIRTNDPSEIDLSKLDQLIDLIENCLIIDLDPKTTVIGIFSKVVRVFYAKRKSEKV